MIQEKIKNLIKEVLKNLVIEVEAISLEHPADLAMGDYSTNLALKVFRANAEELSSSFKDKVRTDDNITIGSFVHGTWNSPKELAEKIVEEINKNLLKEIEKVEAKNGFINFYLSKDFFTNSIKEITENKDFGKNKLLEGKKVMVEYAQPNPFKPFHIGHLMNITIGESIARIVEYSGAKVVHANYQGDIGLHIGKAIYGLLQKGKPDSSLSTEEQAEYIGSCYSYASGLYEEDENIKKEIDEINKKVYERSDEKINELYDWGRKITLDAFETIYKKLGSKFEYYFFESEMAPIGIKIVKENTPNVFEESDGAIVFKAEKYNPKLHTRVFVNSKGLPTYETKEIGLTVTKFKKENPDLSLIITAIEQGEYMKVVQKAVSLIHPDYESRMKHFTYGMMRFASGKMSSRKGNIITGESLIKDVESSIFEKIQDRDFTEEEKRQVASAVGVSALKYSILKQSTSGDIVYDFETSISFEGDSGPYLQYSYARANSLYEKAKGEGVMPSFENTIPEVSELEKMLYRFPEVVSRSLKEYAPHYIANYLIEIARMYNSFYGNQKIIDKDDINSPYKVAITQAFSIVSKNGLYLLGIKAPERM